MTFVLDTDICSAYMKGNNKVANRFTQYAGRLYLSTASLGELYTWTLRAKASPKLTQELNDLLTVVQVLDVTHDVARKFGEIEANYLDHGFSAGDIDLLNAATALVEGFNMVTHNTKDYVNVPGLRVIDWLGP